MFARQRELRVATRQPELMSRLAVSPWLLPDKLADRRRDLHTHWARDHRRRFAPAATVAAAAAAAAAVAVAVEQAAHCASLRASERPSVCLCVCLRGVHEAAPPATRTKKAATEIDDDADDTIIVYIQRSCRRALL